MGSILVVCTGNICRSPMAEGWIRRLLAERGIGGIAVHSAGVAGWEQSGATPEAVQAAFELGADIRDHVARRLIPAMAGEADLVLAMTEEHAEAVSRSAPHSAKKTFTLKELVNILDHSPVEAADGTPTDGLRAAVAFADQQRANGAGATTMDLDIADPLGLGIESYRATAWELDQLVERLMDSLFGAEAIEVVPEASGGVGEGRG